MVIVESYGKNIYLKDQLVGYIARDGLYIMGKKFADITDDGIISISGKEVGEVNDDSDIVINNKPIGYIDNESNFILTINNLDL
ncbi:MAG: hypothetical protein LUC31_01615 [Coprobacillus sp.]|nr:hypothetical protein [Coprobacillus sp.]